MYRAWFVKLGKTVIDYTATSCDSISSAMARRMKTGNDSKVGDDESGDDCIVVVETTLSRDNKTLG